MLSKMNFAMLVQCSNADSVMLDHNTFSCTNAGNFVQWLAKGHTAYFFDINFWASYQVTGLGMVGVNTS